MMYSSPSFQQAICDSPLLFPFGMDVTGQLVQLVHMSASDYAAASFLDQRMLMTNQPIATVPWSDLREAAKTLPLHCHFIFHISHTGSTLLSRLLGSHSQLLSLREPDLLRKLSHGEFVQLSSSLDADSRPGIPHNANLDRASYRERLELFLRLLSRTFSLQQTALIKATSIVNAIADDMLSLVPSSRALLMFVPASTFLPALLDGAMSDIDGHAASRLQRLQNQGWLLDVSLHALSPGERVAMSWLAEMRSLSQLHMTFPQRTAWLDFDAFLNDPADHLSHALNHFGLPADGSLLLDSSLMQRYAKRPEVRFDPELRHHLLVRARDKFCTEIARGLDWLAQVNVPVFGRLTAG